MRPLRFKNKCSVLSCKADGKCQVEPIKGDSSRYLLCTEHLTQLGFCAGCGDHEESVETDDSDEDPLCVEYQRRLNTKAKLEELVKQDAKRRRERIKAKIRAKKAAAAAASDLSDAIAAVKIDE